MQAVDTDSERKKNIGRWLLLIVFVVLPLFAINFGHRAVLATNTASRSDACSMSQDFVKDSLKAPATAEFPMWTQENCTATQAGNAWTVTSYVDAQNAFGALIRSDYTANMTYNPTRDTWTLNGLAIQAR